MKFSSVGCCGGGNLTFAINDTNQEKVLSLFAMSKFLAMAGVGKARLIDL
jgi:hypothetical protein